MHHHRSLSPHSIFLPTFPLSLFSLRAKSTEQRGARNRSEAVRVLSKLTVESLPPSNGGIAQLARAVALQAIGQGFESPYLH